MCGPVYLTQMKRKAVIFHFCWRRWLLVVMAADPFWTPFLDPIIGPHFKPHFWIPCLDAILENAEK